MIPDESHSHHAVGYSEGALSFHESRLQDSKRQVK